MFYTYWKTLCKKEKVFWIFIIFLTLFRIFLFTAIPLDALSNMGHDDLLLVNHAKSLLDKNWLGEYNNLTLVKGISFPAFLALCNIGAIPYGLGLALLYICSVCIFIAAISPLVKKPYIKGIIYLFLLYSPAMLSKNTQQRVYNMAILPAAILLVTASCIALFLRREKNWRVLIPWSFLAGVSLAFFWYVREDSIWLLPFVMGAIGISILCLVFQKRHWKKKIAYICIFIFPFFLFEGISIGIAAVNYHYYHTFTVNERTSSSFTNVLSDLVQIDVDNNAPDNVWVSKAAMSKAMSCSSTLNSIKKEIKDIYQSGWASGGEIQGDIIVWALRDAAANAGYFTDGAVSSEFFSKIHEELQDAYANGKYEKKEGIFFSALSDSFVFSEDFLPLAKGSLKSWKSLLFIDGNKVEIFTGTGTPQELRFFEAMTGEHAIYPDNGGFINDPVKTASQRPVVYAQRLLKIYKASLYLIVPASFLLYLAMTIFMILGIKQKQFDSMYFWLITTGLGGCCMILIVAVRWFTTYLGEAENTVYHYSTGALTMIQLVQIFIFLWSYSVIKKRKTTSRIRSLR